jgi:hypothetical protein
MIILNILSYNDSYVVLKETTNFIRPTAMLLHYINNT